MLLKGHHTTHVLSHSLSASSAHMLTPCQLKGPISQSVSAVLLSEVRSVIEQRVRNTQPPVRHGPGNETCHHSLPPHYSRYNHLYQVISVSQLIYLAGRDSDGLRCWKCDSDDTDCDDTSNHEAEQCPDSESVCLR